MRHGAVFWWECSNDNLQFNQKTHVFCLLALATPSILVSQRIRRLVLVGLVPDAIGAWAD